MRTFKTEDIVRDLWILKKPKVSWNNLMLCCPFHNENNPSFGLVKETHYDWKSFHCKWGCFTCHEKGNSLESLLAKLEDIKYFQARRQIEEMLWIEEWELYLEPLNIEENKRKSKKENEFFTLDEYMEEFETFIPHQYILKRGFNKNSWNKFNFWFSEKRKRIWIPLEDEKWNIVSIIWRSIDKEIQPKYLYINKKEQVEKSNYLFKFNHFDEKEDFCIIVEWPLNAIMIDQFWFPNAFAIMGSKISNVQMDLIMQKYNKIIVWFDNDEAWKDWTKDFLNRANKYKDILFREIYIMSSDKDAAEMTKEEFEETFKNKKKFDFAKVWKTNNKKYLPKQEDKLKEFQNLKL